MKLCQIKYKNADHREKCNSNYRFLEIQVIGLVLAIIILMQQLPCQEQRWLEEAKKVHQYCIICFATRGNNEVIVIKLMKLPNLSRISSFCSSSLQQFKTLFVFLSIKITTLVYKILYMVSDM